MHSEFTKKALIEEIPAITEAVSALLEAADCPVKVTMQIDIAIDEICSNIAYYAYGKDVTGDITVAVDIPETGGSVSITFSDSGKPYNPLEKEDPDVTLSAEERQIGGLGIFMVKKSMDEMLYEHKDGQNHLTIRKSW